MCAKKIPVKKRIFREESRLAAPIAGNEGGKKGEREYKLILV